MKKLRLPFYLLILLFGLSHFSAQTTLPLAGPLVAATNARQDQILLYDVGSGSLRELSFGYGEQQVWGFSPDGCRILFTLDSGDQHLPQLYTARLDGSDAHLMAQYTDNFDPTGVNAWGVWEPTWSSTGRIAFTLWRDLPQPDGTVEQQSHIVWIDGNGGTPQFYSNTGDEFSPAWSPDGQWLAYVSYTERAPGADVYSTAVPTVAPPPGQTTTELPAVREADLWVVSLDGGLKYPLTDFATGSVRSPRWSPDGELIGFLYSPTTGEDTIWMIANQSGAIATQLSFHWNLTLDHTWLPDSTAMIASIRDFRGLVENRLWRIPLIGNADSDATLYLTDAAFTYTDYPRFSADGRYLALRSEYSLVIVDLSDNTWRRLYADQPGNTPPVWTPAGFRGESACP